MDHGSDRNRLTLPWCYTSSNRPAYLLRVIDASKERTQEENSLASLDRAAFINIITEGQGDIGGAMQPPPEGLWGMPPEMLKTLPSYNPMSRITARKPASSCASSVTGPVTGSR